MTTTSGTGQHFDVRSEGVRLAGTVEIPTSAGPHPAAVLISGSGPLDRDSNTAKMRLDVSKAVAAGLLSHGIASLRYDKRGVGASSGDYLSAGFDDETDDARAALDALRGHRDVDAGRVIVIGHSAGATIAMRLSRWSTPPAGYVFLAGAAMTGEQVMEWQTDRIAASMPRPHGLRARRFVQRQARDRTALRDRPPTPFAAHWSGGHARWLREFMAYDPTEALATIDRPVLAITGAKDLQVDAADVARIGEIVTASFDGDVPSDLTHVLRRDPGAPSLGGYREQFRRPVDRWVVDRVATWARSHLVGFSD